MNVLTNTSLTFTFKMSIEISEICRDTYDEKKIQVHIKKPIEVNWIQVGLNIVGKI